MRESGYYWVKQERLDWEIAKWETSWRGCEQWAVCGAELYQDDSDFEEIDENRIERVVNKKCEPPPPSAEDIKMAAEYNALFNKHGLRMDP